MTRVQCAGSLIDAPMLCGAVSRSGGVKLYGIGTGAYGTSPTTRGLAAALALSNTAASTRKWRKESCGGYLHFWGDVNSSLEVPPSRASTRSGWIGSGDS